MGPKTRRDSEEYSRFLRAYLGGKKLRNLDDLAATGFKGVSSGDLEVLHRWLERDLANDLYVLGGLQDMGIAMIAAGAAIVIIRPTGAVFFLGCFVIAIALTCFAFMFYINKSMEATKDRLIHIDLAQMREVAKPDAPSSIWRRALARVFHVASLTGPSV